MQIYSKNIYEIIENSIKKYILILYNVSNNHYIGLPIHNGNKSNSIYIKSINKYINPSDTS